MMVYKELTERKTHFPLRFNFSSTCPLDWAIGLRRRLRSRLQYCYCTKKVEACTTGHKWWNDHTLAYLPGRDANLPEVRATLAWSADGSQAFMSKLMNCLTPHSQHNSPVWLDVDRNMKESKTFPGIKLISSFLRNHNSVGITIGPYCSPGM